MESAQKDLAEPDELHERARRELMRTLETHGKATLADLGAMSDCARTKWLFWNLHENLEQLRKLEPTLIGQIIRTQVTIGDGQSIWSEKYGLEKRIELSCKWQLLLKDDSYRNDEAFAISEGWIDLYVGNAPPAHPALQERQKGYLDSDSPLYPNQLFLYGWVGEGVWEEIKAQLYNASANTHTDIFVRDNFIFPVKPGHPFVSGPAGSLGLTNFEFRVSSHPRLTTWVKP